MESHSYAINNPLGYVDPDGNEVIAVVYPNFQVAYHGTHTLGGVVLVAKDGSTHYFESGRCAGPDGETRNAGPNNVSRPSVERDASGNITQASMNNLLQTPSQASGKGGEVDALVIPTTTAEDENILNYLTVRQAQNTPGATDIDAQMFFERRWKTPRREVEVGHICESNRLDLCSHVLSRLHFSVLRQIGLPLASWRTLSRQRLPRSGHYDPRK